MDNKKDKMTTKQIKKVNMLIRAECCNCYLGNCICLNKYPCPQINNRMKFKCEWFEKAVLPLNKVLEAELLEKTEDVKSCVICGAKFASKSNNVKYCPDCRRKIKNKQNAESIRKKRSIVGK